MRNPLLTVQDVARRYAVSRQTVHNWCRQGILPFLAIPGGKRFDVERLEQWERERSFPRAARVAHANEASGRPA